MSESIAKIPSLLPDYELITQRLDELKATRNRSANQFVFHERFERSWAGLKDEYRDHESVRESVGSAVREDVRRAKQLAEPFTTKLEEQIFYDLVAQLLLNASPR